MALTEIRGGAMVDIPTQEEIRQIVPTREEIRQIVSAELRGEYRGVKHMRLPFLSGKPAASALKLGADQGQQVIGPQSGYVWSLRRLVVTGLVSGGTPDVVNLYRNSTAAAPNQDILWQFNGNNFGYTFNMFELVLESGESLALVNSGTIAATGLITLSGELVEVPSEMIAKLIST